MLITTQTHGNIITTKQELKSKYLTIIMAQFDDFIFLASYEAQLLGAPHFKAERWMPQ